VILLIDNFDSFVHNLARYFARLGCQTRAVRSDEMEAAAIEKLRPQAIVISPGPCTPAEAGCSVDVVRRLYDRVPMLGVCLGHQAIAAAFGAKIVRAPQPVHGRTSAVTHDGRGAFSALPSPLKVCRYHSLVVNEATLPRELEVTARTDDGVIMAIAHCDLPVVGVQFHPEAVLTEHGHGLLANFLRIAGLPVTEDSGAFADEFPPPPTDPRPLSAAQVVF
jgi:anthranilate synthase/aminodeoxychorismate synthase-like glutamine amidotransferase